MVWALPIRLPSLPDRAGPLLMFSSGDGFYGIIYQQHLVRLAESPIQSSWRKLSTGSECVAVCVRVYVVESVVALEITNNHLEFLLLLFFIITSKTNKDKSLITLFFLLLLLFRIWLDLRVKLSPFHIVKTNRKIRMEEVSTGEANGMRYKNKTWRGEIVN